MKSLVLAFVFTCDAFAQDSFRVKISGKGQPIILIPGLSSSGETWDTTVARYRDRYECHVLTLAGFAGVPPVTWPSTGMLPKVRDDIAAYIRDKKLIKPIVIGHSLGGFLALDFASTYPELLSKLVIVDSYPFTMGLNPAVTPESARSIAVQIRDGILGSPKEEYDANIRTGTSTNAMVTSEAGKKRLIEWSMETDRHTLADALSEMLGSDLREQLRKITVPVMVLGTWIGNEQYGANLQVVEKNMHDQYSNVKGVEIHVSDTSRHFIMWDAPEWMFAHLDRFLTR